MNRLMMILAIFGVMLSFALIIFGTHVGNNGAIQNGWMFAFLNLLFCYLIKKYL
ncbi:MAG: hypothetical protein J6583_04560 [Gilliamella sp.]|nr:hypothetical protein [Gilliamella sp.]